jgi:magnesium chelatase subunit I
VAEAGDRTPVAWLEREARYVEKLATPDVTIADMIGDIDPIKAARAGLQLSNELTMHYGLLPRANRSIFAINELPTWPARFRWACSTSFRKATSRSKATRCGCRSTS